MIQTLLFVFLGLVAGPAQAAAQTCQPQDLDGPLAGRARFIQFPDGRKITVAGHAHGKRQFISVINAAITDGSLQKMSRQQLEKLLLKIEANNSKPLARSETLDPTRKQSTKSIAVQAREDLAYIRTLKKSGEEFLGWEGTPEMLATYEVNRQNTYNQLLSAIADHRRKSGGFSLSAARVDDILLGSANADNYVYMKNPKMKALLPQVGIEDVAAAEAFKRANSGDGIVRSWNELADKVETISPESLSQKQIDSIQTLNRLVNSIMVMQVAKTEELERSIGAVSAHEIPGLRPLYQNVYRALRARFAVHQKRNQAAARNLAAMHRSGTFFVGSNHLTQVVDNLMQECREELLQTNFSAHSESNEDASAGQ